MKHPNPADPFALPMTEEQHQAAEDELRAQALAACVRKNEDWHRRNDARAFELQSRVPEFIKGALG